MTPKKKDLGELLLEKGLISEDQLDEAKEEQQRTGRSLGRILVERGWVTESGLIALLARQIGLEFVELTDISVDTTAAGLIPESLAKRYRALPIGYEDSKLIVAMSDPSNVLAIDDIRTLTGREVKPVVATATDILAAISRVQRLDRTVQNIASPKHDERQQLPVEEEDIAETGDDAPIVRLVNLLITQAVAERASDIHVEPQERDLRIRYRIDGVLHEVMRSPKTIQGGVVSRLKIMGEMDIAERRIPQDGRIGLVVGGKAIDVRVASLPTVYGEKVVLRILDKSSALMKLEDLGFLETNFKRFERAFLRPYGMILATGPTGSGKSTTLYATLNILNKTDRNIITVEDPVEYRLAGVNQMQVNTKAGLTFANALRSILRADPDIVLIGEIRDRETAQIGIEAALTGHLVLTTMHTNDAPSAVTRLTEMGIEPFLVSSAVDAVVAQRLARRLCEKCKEPYLPTREALLENRFPIGDEEEVPKIFRGVGCAYCSRTGYRGRLALHEVMIMSEDIERLAVERRSSEEIARVAEQQGMITLRIDGLEKVRMGLTSLEEIQRVVV
ncbi:MAG: GspE/PulE family protein [Actinomycetota bacterium]